MKKIWLCFVEKFRIWIDPLSKFAQICAVVIAGYWTYHLHLITGEDELRPMVSVSAQVIDNSEEGRVVAVYITEKNSGKVPIELEKNALSVSIKKIPKSQPAGYIDIDKQPVFRDNKDFMKRYGEGTQIDPNVEFNDLELFVLPKGLYRIEAIIDLPEGDSVNGFTVLKVE